MIAFEVGAIVACHAAAGLLNTGPKEPAAGAGQRGGHGQAVILTQHPDAGRDGEDSERDAGFGVFPKRNANGVARLLHDDQVRD